MVKIWQNDDHIFIGGIIVNHHFKKVRTALEKACRENSRLVIDLAELEYIDRAGAIELFELLSEMQNSGRRIELSNVRERVLFSFLQLSAELFVKAELFSKAG
ncbi:STAS domain-containing protein [Desulfotomaculum copahuensis]|uniref:STAS domain-containing protein n=1 Tax=Desulfotomaculum copahuensis TaxID=1838280 RepID=A0A1B7LE46_9FIRM|nr:STAS domain-containing protein [Desulfotomaculum copahuensis]OAT81369.1 hypothetical protein A6M21_10850 [Desulfotomaculum copahuensis]